MGGLIKITHRRGDYDIYGITAGHLLNPVPDVQDSLSSDHREDTDRDSDDSTSEDEAESDIADDDASILQAQKPAPVAYNMTTFGHIIDQASRKSSDCPPKHDWCLLMIQQKADLKPNLLRGLTAHHRSREAELTVPSEENTRSPTARQVLLNSCSADIQHGTLSPLPCAVWLGHEDGSFVDALSLQMNNDTGKQGNLLSL